MVNIWNNNIVWLVVWNMNFMTFHILGIIIPTDEFILFHQPDGIFMGMNRMEMVHNFFGHSEL